MIVKFCSFCNEWKLRDDYYITWRVSEKKFRFATNRCKTCRNKLNQEYRRNNVNKWTRYSKRYYEKNKSRLKVEVSDRKDKYRSKWYELFKSAGYHVCRNCGYSKCFAAIDFHHEDPNSKNFNISEFAHCRATTKTNIAIVWEELQKCISLCSNCHRELHSSRNSEDD